MGFDAVACPPHEIAADVGPLLSATIKNALRTEFYREHWRDVLPTGPVAIDLAALPFVRKHELITAGARAQIRDGQICRDKVTGGTTGLAFVNLVGERELAILSEYYTAVHSAGARQCARRGVRFLDTHVAFERTIPTPIRFHDLSIYGAGSFGLARHALSARHVENGVDAACTVLAAGERILRALTDDTKEFYQGPWPGELDYIFTYSNFLTKSSREDYENTWGGRVIDRYGLSEAVGGATQHPQCGWYHFDPVVVPEVVGFNSRSSVAEGLGVLVITTLFPFQECQPLIRYWTDDIVEVTHSRSSIPGRLAVRPLGRAHLGIADPLTDSWYATPDVFFEVLEPQMDIVRQPLFRDSPQVRDPERCGLPVYRLRQLGSHGRRRLVLEVSVTVRGGRRQSVLDQIGDQVLLRAPALAQACERGDLEFDVVDSKFDA